MNIILNGELFEEVVYFRYLLSIIKVNGNIETAVKSRVWEVVGGMSALYGCRSLRMNAKR